MKQKRDVPIVLTGIDYEDNYEGDFTTRRAIIYTLSFTAKFYLYGHLLHSLLSNQFKLTSLQIYQTNHLRENKDIVSHQNQYL